MNTRTRLAIVAYLVAVTSSTQAGTIFDNGSPPANMGIDAWFADPLADSLNDQVADDFTLSAGQSTIRDIHWWGTDELLTGLEGDNFTLTIFNAHPTLPFPGTVNTVATILSLLRTDYFTAGSGVYLYSAQVADIALAPDTKYWLGISNFVGRGWGWVSTQQSGSLVYRAGLTPQDSWSLGGKAAAFYLTDDIIPEPSTFALVIVGTVIGVLPRRKRLS